MPDLTGLTEAEAQSRAKLYDLQLVVERAATYKQPKGKVFDQFPYKAKDLVSRGDKVTIFVSTGYPPEAKEVTVSRTISPAVRGKESTVKIVYSDARGDNIEGPTRTITDAQTFDVHLVLSPEKDGTIQYFVDGKRVDIYTVPYKEFNNPNPPQGNAPGNAPAQGSGGNSGNNAGAATTQGTGTNDSGDSANAGGRR
jgi:serine/threonine-protein kinase